MAFSHFCEEHVVYYNLINKPDVRDRHVEQILLSLGVVNSP